MRSQLKEGHEFCSSKLHSSRNQRIIRHIPDSDAQFEGLQPLIALILLICDYWWKTWRLNTTIYRDENSSKSAVGYSGLGDISSESCLGHLGYGYRRS